eukprot:g22585.t1
MPDKKAEMKWDGSKFYQVFQVGTNGWESFQLLVGGRWEECVYPSIADGCPFVKYELRGPDNKGHGKNWTVGRHPEDPAKAGHRIRVAVSVNAQGLPKELLWLEVSLAEMTQCKLQTTASAGTGFCCMLPALLFGSCSTNMAAFVLAPGPRPAHHVPTHYAQVPKATPSPATAPSTCALRAALVGSLVATAASARAPKKLKTRSARASRVVRHASTKLDDSGAWSFVHLKNGDSEAKVYLRGANVTSFKVGGVEWIGLRADCKLDGSKANISGGLPICFPQFGPGEVIPQHGFARNMDWTFVEGESSDGKCVLELENLSESECTFTTGIHSYFATSDIDKLGIVGKFKGCTYEDPVQAASSLIVFAGDSLD